MGAGERSRAGAVYRAVLRLESASSAAVTFRILHGNRYERFGAFGLRNGIVCAMDTVGSLQGGIMGYVVSLLCFLGCWDAFRSSDALHNGIRTRRAGICRPFLRLGAARKRRLA